MPTRPLILTDTFSTIQIWLNENIKDEKSIKACCHEIENIPINKGIYFWFMHPNGYKELSKINGIKSIKPIHKRNINGQLYDLVYVGTAGVRNNKNGINNGHLKERFKWHLRDNKSVSALCSGTMSTYRRTLGGLISDDLIANDTQSKLDDILSKYFYVYYIEYPGSFLEVKDVVNSDEDVLIDIIQPIFNLDKNRNAQNPNHITHSIQQRRQQVESSSKNRWSSDKTNAKLNTKITKSVQPKDRGANIISEEGCVEFKFTRYQNIAKIANDIPNLPIGPCFIELFYNNKTDVRIYINGITRNIRTVNRTVCQYFNAPDTNYGNILRWEIVQTEMNNPKKIIKEITVRICPL